MRRVIASLMLGSTFIFSASTFEVSWGQARVTSSRTTVENFDPIESAACFVETLASRAARETVQSAIEFTRKGRKEINRSAGPGYVANKRVAIDMTEGFLAVHGDKMQAIKDLAEQLNHNLALQQGTREGINQVILKYLKSR